MKNKTPAGYYLILGMTVEWEANKAKKLGYLERNFFKIIIQFMTLKTKKLDWLSQFHLILIDKLFKNFNYK